MAAPGDGVQPALTALRGRGFALAVLTNGSSTQHLVRNGTVAEQPGPRVTCVDELRRLLPHVG